MKPNPIRDAKSAFKLCRQNRGFALIVTLSLMILLTVIAVGLLTLSSTSLRSSSTTLDSSRAKANARMALMLAIGELQKQAGPDTRVTARADILGENNGPVLGVWKSWEGDDHEKGGNFAGRPITPEGGYKSAKKSRFLAWLTSVPNQNNSNNPPDTNRAPSKVELVGEGSVGKTASAQKLQVHLEPSKVNLKNSDGAYAWWIGGENQKARLSKSYEAGNSDEAGWAAIAKSYSVANPKIFKLGSLLEPTNFDNADKMISLRQTEIVADSRDTKYFHDLSTVSTGLLTNTATGGWRKDLSLFTENYDNSNFVYDDLPLFRITTEQDTACDIPQPSGTNAFSDTSLLYPWAAPLDKDGDSSIASGGAVANWANLKDYTLLYRKFDDSSDLSISTNSYNPNKKDPSGNGNTEKYFSTVRRIPLVARIQMIYSYSSRKIGTSGKYEAGVLLTPVFTLWNPYNVKLNPSISGDPGENNGMGGSIVCKMTNAFPVALQFTFGSDVFEYLSIAKVSVDDKKVLEPDYGFTRMLGWRTPLTYIISGTENLTLEAGEMRVFSPNLGITKRIGPTSAPENANEINLSPGYKAGGGHFLPISNDFGKGDEVQEFSSGISMRVNARFNTEFVDVNSGIGLERNTDPGVGSSCEINSNGTSSFIRIRLPQQVMADFHPPFREGSYVFAPSLEGLESQPMPFLSMILGDRMASYSNSPAKGLIQSSPLVNHMEMGYDSGKAAMYAAYSRSEKWTRYRGMTHPINSSLDFSFVQHVQGDSLEDLYIPNTETDDGYAFSGFRVDNGLSRCIAAELPTQPLASLAELQHWDLRFANPVPPYAFNIIGNSDATPLLPQSGVVNTQAIAGQDPDSARSKNRQFDDAYCANHLLFDDWFFSSISAGNPEGFGRGGSVKQCFTDFVTENKQRPLANRSYKPIGDDISLTQANPSNANRLFNEHVDTSESWRTIASRIEVEGMFNVNSTSVEAWKALLSHAQSRKTPYYPTLGNVGLSSPENNVFSRTSIAGDVAAGNGGRAGFANSSQFAGYRAFTDRQIENFAEKIVDQIRKRGPFLSLSEFVNRQLSDNVDLALAGTIQAALNELAKPSSGNLYNDFINAYSPEADRSIKRSKNALAEPLGFDGSAGDFSYGTEYEFPEAAVGISLYGMPGWTRQADVLRPLAPILSARDDTFVIRGYGDSRDAKDNIKARAVCEAIVRRTRNYTDDSEKPDRAEPIVSETNKKFGRRFEIVSFRWLAAAEI